MQSVLRVPETEHANMVRVFGWRRKMLPVSTLMPARFAIFMPTARKCWRCWTFCFTSPMQTAICTGEENFCTLLRRFSKLTKAAYAACRRAMTVRFKTRMWCWACSPQAVMRRACRWLEIGARQSSRPVAGARPAAGDDAYCNGRMAAINDAWETIRKERGL